MSNPYAPPSSTVIRLDKPKLDGEPVRRWDLSVIKQAETLMQARVGENIGVALITFGVSIAMTLVSTAVQQVATRGGADPQVAMIVGQVISLTGNLLQGYLGIGALRFYLAQVRGQDTSLLEVFRGWPWVLPIVLGNVLVGLAAVASILLLFIPMIVLGLGWMFWQAFVIDEDMGAVDALTASWRLTKGSKVDLFVFGLVLGLMNLVGMLLCGVGLLFTLPLSGLASMMVYDNLRIVGPKEV
ncbi:MAG: hypothetical protein JNM72_17730 [Deltaproteobacteria bacterium]|nr:hypothetical protein [Deltaproteobacteria bacterium]